MVTLIDVDSSSDDVGGSNRCSVHKSESGDAGYTGTVIWSTTDLGLCNCFQDGPAVVLQFGCIYTRGCGVGLVCNTWDIGR
jgi:hypothetical protein